MDCAFVPPLAARASVQRSISPCARPLAANTRHRPRQGPLVAAAAQPGHWARVAIGVVGFTLGTVLPGFRGTKDGAPGFPSAGPAPVVAAVTIEVPVFKADGSLPLPALGIKQEEYVSHRELARRKTTQYSEAEEEIMELEEDQFETQWFHDLQVMWAALASVGGIVVLYKGGVLWEKWIHEQEQKDMEEEIELTGTFIDPRAVRKDEDAEDDGKKKKKKKGGEGPDGNSQSPSNGSNGSDPDSSPPDSDLPTGGIDALERLFGKS
jgi:hypothetical protein